MAEITLREAVAADTGLLLRLIRELAAYERQPDAVIASEDDLRRHGFGPERRFEALIAAIDGNPAGYALFFPNFSTWTGCPGLYLEDLYVNAWARRQGVGRRLLARLAAIAVARGWSRLDLQVLDWNPAREFYHRLGIAPPQSVWLPYRLDGEALRRLAGADSVAPE
jgi:GNAT superfamily N-acetyltransferase